MDALECRQRFGSARVARLATVSLNGMPHLVPITFVLVGEDIYSAVDTKPKRTTSLRRITNIRETGRACLLADQYAEDWSTLWRVRVDADATVLDVGQVEFVIDALARKYPQYAAKPPPGPVIHLQVRRWIGWRAS
jgi:PPOX class probable F420-dependent enzyme